MENGPSGKREWSYTPEKRVDRIELFVQKTLVAGGERDRSKGSRRVESLSNFMDGNYKKMSSR